MIFEGFHVMWEPFLLQIMKEILIDFRSGAKNSVSFFAVTNIIPMFAVP